MDNQKQLGKDPILKLLLKFSVPAIVGMLINVLYNIVDRIFIGKGVGSYAINGLGITLPFMTIIMAFGMLVGIGGGALISIRLGEKNLKEAKHILGNIFILLIIVSIALTVVCLIGLDPLLKMFGASEKTISYARDYLKIILLGTLFQNIGFGLNYSIRSVGNPVTAMMTNLLGAIINIILDYIFIMKFGWGIKGAAIATVIGQTANTIWVLAFFLRKDQLIRLERESMKLDKNIIKAIIAIGMSPFFIQFAASAINVIANRALISTGGDYAVGAMSIVISISMIFLMPIFGIVQGNQPIIGYNYGAKQYDRVKQAVKLANIFATTICIIGFLLVKFSPEILASIFLKDKEMINLSAQGMNKMFMMLPLIGAQIVISNFFQAINKAKIALLLSMLRQVIILIPLLLFMPKMFGIDGVWYSYPISDVVSFIVTLGFMIWEFRVLAKEDNENKKNQTV